MTEVRHSNQRIEKTTSNQTGLDFCNTINPRSEIRTIQETILQKCGKIGGIGIIIGLLTSCVHPKYLKSSEATTRPTTQSAPSDTKQTSQPQHSLLPEELKSFNTVLTFLDEMRSLTPEQRKERLAQIAKNSLLSYLSILTAAQKANPKNNHPALKTTETESLLLHEISKEQTKYTQWLNSHLEKIKQAKSKGLNDYRKFVEQLLHQAKNTEIIEVAQKASSVQLDALLSATLVSLYYKTEKIKEGKYNFNAEATFPEFFAHIPKSHTQKPRPYKQGEKLTARCLSLAVFSSDLIHLTINALGKKKLINPQNAQITTTVSPVNPQKTSDSTLIPSLGTAVEHVYITIKVNGHTIFLEPTSGSLYHLSLLSKLLKIPENYQPQHIAGLGALILGDTGTSWLNANPQKALDLYQVALSINPNDHMNQSNAGIALSKLNQPIQAQKHFQKALDLNHLDYPTPELGLAQTTLQIAIKQQDPQLKSQHLAKAESITQELIKKIRRGLRDPHGEHGQVDRNTLLQTRIPAHLLLVQIHFYQKKYQTVLTELNLLEKFIVNKELPFVHYLRGKTQIALSTYNCHKGLKNIEKATKAYNHPVYNEGYYEAIKICSREKQILQKATDYANQGKYALAMIEFQHLATINPNNTAYARNVEICKINLAARELNQALSIYNDPQHKNPTPSILPKITQHLTTALSFLKNINTPHATELKTKINLLNKEATDFHK